jgi:thiamine-monophosphate kinase
MPGPNSGDGGGGEFEAIERLAGRLQATGARAAPGEVWIGDDAAVLDPPAGRMLFTTDLVVEGVHGDLDLLSSSDLGWRAMVASLSDIAAMGGQPRHAVVAVSGPPGTDLDGLYDGIAQASAAFGCPVVGGDLSGGECLVVALAMTGEVSHGPGPVLRSGARPGDRLLVTGPLGAAAAGLRLLRSDSGGAGTGGTLVAAHRRPQPRLGQGEVARQSGVRAMIDVSDGLAGDLVRLADASGIGFRLEDVPVAEGATLDDALSGGEDYELVMATADPDALSQGLVAAGLAAPLVIGVCVEDGAERTLQGRKLAAGGWEHHFV